MISPDPDTTIYEGTWRGSYVGGVNGTFIMYVTGIGTVSGTWANDSIGSGTSFGTVTESGFVKQAFANGGKEAGN